MTNIVKFNDAVEPEDHLEVNTDMPYDVVGFRITDETTSVLRELQVAYAELSYEDTAAVAAHLTDAVAPHTDPAVMLAWGKAIVADALARMPVSPKPKGYGALSAQSKTVYQHMRRAGSISVREAMNDYGIAGGTLSRRIVDIKEAGFGITKERRRHPISGRMYTRYSLAA